MLLSTSMLFGPIQSQSNFDFTRARGEGGFNWEVNRYLINLLNLLNFALPCSPSDHWRIIPFALTYYEVELENEIWNKCTFWGITLILNDHWSSKLCKIEGSFIFKTLQNKQPMFRLHTRQPWFCLREAMLWRRGGSSRFALTIKCHQQHFCKWPLFCP